MGLDDGYTVSSEDISNYEKSAEPLENLSKFAGYFLAVIIGIGVVVLAVFNIFSIRERKYEVGVLTAIGMKKKKVVQLFISEILIIAIVGTIIGGGIGAITSVPITNKLLTFQTTSQNNDMEAKNDAFGREFNGPDDKAQTDNGDADSNSESGDNSSSGSTDNNGDKPADGEDGGGLQMPFASQIMQVTSSVDVGVLAELLLLSIAIAVISAMASVVMIMRYDPLEILSNRD
jgi:putative ABC transport system permease protein